MNKNVLYIGMGLGAAGIAYLLYKYMQTPSQIYSTTSLNPYSNPNASNETTYPFVASVPARVDNSNQPWAANNRAALAQVSAPQVNVNLSNANMIADYASSLDKISTSLTSIWEDFGVADWFNSGDADSFIADMDYDSAGDWWSGSGSDLSQFGDIA